MIASRIFFPEKGHLFVLALMHLFPRERERERERLMESNQSRRRTNRTWSWEFNGEERREQTTEPTETTINLSLHLLLSQRRKSLRKFYVPRVRPLTGLFQILIRSFIILFHVQQDSNHTCDVKTTNFFKIPIFFFQNT